MSAFFTFRNLFIFFCTVVVALSCKKETVDQSESLQSVATFPIGNNYRNNGRDFYNWNFPNGMTLFGKSGYPDRNQYLPEIRRQILTVEFSSITPETCLKMHVVSKGPDQYDFSEADKMVDYAKQTGKRIHGHVLIWPSSVPDWIRHVNWTEQQYEDWLKTYIHTVVGRYKDDIASWDVINEPFTSFFGSGFKQKEDNFWLYHIGDDYIEKAFRWAEEADPDVLLFINEVGMESDDARQRRKNFLALADSLSGKGVKVDGIGYQFHLINPYIDEALMKTLIDEVAEKNYLFHISEFDIQMNFPVGDKKEMTYFDYQQQRKAYNVIAYSYQKYVPENLRHGITMWGISDVNAFCNIYLNLRVVQPSEDFPHLWDKNFEKKDAYYGFLNGLKGVLE